MDGHYLATRMRRYEAVIEDPRVPFATRRATQSELLRYFTELTSIKISRANEAALAALVRGSKKAAEPPTIKPPKPEAPRLTKRKKPRSLTQHS